MVSRKSQAGQALLIVILVMVVALTVGLSVITRSITTIRTSKEEESSQRAFSAAEAGVEKIVNSTSTTLQGSLSNKSSYSTKVTTVAGNTLLANNGNVVLKDDSVDIWLSTYPSYASPFTGTLTVYWGSGNETCSNSETTNTQAALEIVVLSGTVSSPVATHYALDPCSSRSTANNFSNSLKPGGMINGKQLNHSYDLALTNALLARVIPLYASTPIGVDGNGKNLPSQGQVIESTGSSGETQRKVTVYKSYPKVPVAFFPYMLFSH
jgi:Tfp pilus assembly protein PilX